MDVSITKKETHQIIVMLDLLIGTSEIISDE